MRERRQERKRKTVRNASKSRGRVYLLMTWLHLRSTSDLKSRPKGGEKWGEKGRGKGDERGCERERKKEEGGGGRGKKGMRKDRNMSQ